MEYGLLQGLIILIKKNKLFFLFLGLMLIILNLHGEKAYASAYGLQASYGTGNPDQLQGYRIAFQQFWPWIGFRQAPLNLTGYWDLSFANWRTNPPQANQPRSISILAVSPLIRLQSHEHWLLAAQPYLELGIGASFLSNNHLGHRNLGGQFAFQDLIGLGLRWSKTQAWSLSYHYLHYSNASLFPPNQGIDVKHLFTLGYEF
jgi:lipid A 3-O-deacylase